MSDHREAIAEVIHEGGWQIGANRREEWRWCKALPRERSAAYAKADALLGSDVLAQIRAEARAEALREAALDVGPALQNEVGGHTSTYSVRQWLNARAEGSA